MKKHRRPKLSAVLIGAVAAAAAVVCAVTVAGGAAVTAGTLKAAAADNEDRDRRAFSKLLTDPHFASLTRDPVWDGPEWAAVSEAQDKADQQLYGPAVMAMHEQNSSLWPGAMEITRQGIDAVEASLIRDHHPSVPLGYEDLQVPLYATAIHAKAACSSGDPGAYLEGLSQLTPMVGTAGSELRRVWDENAPVLIEAAAVHYCQDAAARQ